MMIEVKGLMREGDRYRKLLDACLAHFDKLKVTSPWRHRELTTSGFTRAVLEASDRPTSDWTFHVVFEDDDFGVWFRLRYT